MRYFRRTAPGSPRTVAPPQRAIVCGALTTLSHTEAPIYAVALAIYIWAMKSRAWKGLRDGTLVAAGVLLAGGWWYALTVYRHGLAPFRSISYTGAHSPWRAISIQRSDACTGATARRASHSAGRKARVLIASILSATGQGAHPCSSQPVATAPCSNSVPMMPRVLKPRPSR